MTDPTKGEPPTVTPFVPPRPMTNGTPRLDHRTAIERGAHLLALSTLKNAEIPYVVAGAYALQVYTGVYRETKDLDIFLRQQDVERAMEELSMVGFQTSMRDPVWIAKAYATDNYFADLIFNSGNGVAKVDDLWISRGKGAVIHGLPILVAAPEEIIWSKAFVCERERFDGADVNHLILACGETMDWRHLLRRFDSYWEVLLAHLVMYRFSYPGQRHRVPGWIWEELLDRGRAGRDEQDAEALCRGLLLSRTQYQVDLEQWGFQDARLVEVEAFGGNGRKDSTRRGR